MSPPNSAFRENSFLTSTGKLDQDIMIGEAPSRHLGPTREEKDRSRHHGPSDLRCLLQRATSEKRFKVIPPTWDLIEDFSAPKEAAIRKKQIQIVSETVSPAYRLRSCWVPEALAQKLESSISSAFQRKSLSGHGVSEEASGELSASHAGTGQLASLNHGFRTFHTLSAFAE